jgi:anti-sigma factor RsiW
MNCRRTRERLSAYLDGEASSDEEAQIRKHLAACPRCAHELAGLKRLEHVLDTLEGMSPSAGFARGVRGAAERVWQGAPKATCSTMWLSPVALRAAALLMLVGGVWAGYTAGDAATRSSAQGGTQELSDLDLSVDLLSAAPTGSLADAYRALVDDEG